MNKTPTRWRAVCQPEAWQHAAADALHGWSLHVHHAGGEIELTRAAYEGALEAATTSDSRGDYIPHEPAMSPHKRRRIPAPPVPNALRELAAAKDGDL